MDNNEPEINSEQPKSNKLIDKFKSFKKTPFLIAGLVILTGILLVVSLNLGSKPKTPTSKALEEDFAHTSLSISEEIRESTISGVFEVDVDIDTNDNKVTGVQLELEYDPEILTNVDITNGGFFTDPQVIIKSIDAENKRITYVVAIKTNQVSVTGEGRVAVISFEKISDEDTFLNFLPQTLVSAEGFSQSVLKETISTVIRKLHQEL